jgi:hypothetical protein
MPEGDISDQRDGVKTLIVSIDSFVEVSKIEQSVCEQFQKAAFQKYKEAVVTYGSKLWREARSAAHQRNPDADAIEVTTPDVEAAIVRLDMKLSRLRQIKFPFRTTQQVLTLITGFIFKMLVDAAMAPQTDPRRASLPSLLIGFPACILCYVILITLESRAEAQR